MAVKQYENGRRGRIESFGGSDGRSVCRLVAEHAAQFVFEQAAEIEAGNADFGYTEAAAVDVNHAAGVNYFKQYVVIVRTLVGNGNRRLESIEVAEVDGNVDSYL